VRADFSCSVSSIGASGATMNIFAMLFLFWCCSEAGNPAGSIIFA
jgi:hypothetical protein